MNPLLPRQLGWSKRLIEDQEKNVQLVLGAPDVCRDGMAHQHAAVLMKWVASITVMHLALNHVIRVRFPGDPPGCALCKTSVAAPKPSKVSRKG